MKYYAKIYPGSGRPTGQVEKETRIDTENHITMNRWTLLGEFESDDVAWENYRQSVTHDSKRFEQWK